MCWTPVTFRAPTNFSFEKLSLLCLLGAVIHTSPAFVTQGWTRNSNSCGFTHIKQFCNPSWMSQNSPQCWHYLPGEVSDPTCYSSHMKPLPTPLSQAPVRLLPVLLTDRLQKEEVPMIPSCGWINLSEGLT